MEGRLQPTISSLQVINDHGLWFMEYVNSIVTPISGINLGYLIFFPFISLLFDIDINQSITFFFNFLFYLSFIWSIYFYNKICNFNVIKNFTIFFIIILSFYFVSNELFGLVAEYCVYFFSPIMLIPYFYFLKKNIDIKNRFLISTFFFITVIGLVFSFIKDFAIIGSLLFGLFFLFEKKKIRYFVLTSILIIIFVPIVVKNYVGHKQIKNYEILYNKKPEIDNIVGANKYISFYSGLGFISNNYVKEFTDEEAAKMLKKRNKNYKVFLTITNEKLAKKEIINIIKKDKNFFFRNIFAKIGVIFMWILAFTNIGLLYFLFMKTELREKLAIFIMLSFYSIFPIITIPTTFYMMGIFGVCISYLLIFLVFFEKKQIAEAIKKLKF